MTKEQTALLAEIENTEISPEDVLRAEAFLATFANSTAALTALSMVLRDTHRDDHGADLLLGFALDRFAPHEATQM